MKVRLTFTLDVNEEEWCDEFGVFPSILRADVKSYFDTHVRGAVAVEDGLVTVVEVK